MCGMWDVNLHHVQFGPPPDEVYCDDQRGHSPDCCGATWFGKEKQRFDKTSKNLTKNSIDVSRAAHNLRQLNLT